MVLSTTNFAIVGFISMGLHKLLKVDRTCTLTSVAYVLTFGVRCTDRTIYYRSLR